MKNHVTNFIYSKNLSLDKLFLNKNIKKTQSKIIVDLMHSKYLILLPILNIIVIIYFAQTSKYI